MLINGPVEHVNYFRPHREGPELELENAVAGQIPTLFGELGSSLWAAGSVPIGAGEPDLVVVAFEPCVYALAQTDLASAEILAYLRAVTRARTETISQRVNVAEEVIVRTVQGLVDIEAVSPVRQSYKLCPEWREVLPEIVTIEAKISNWRRAIHQAARNRVFAHRSYLALPERVASRVRKQDQVQRLGLGVISVDDNGDVVVLRRPRRRNPLVWLYYYKLALVIAQAGASARCPTQ